MSCAANFQDAAKHCCLVATGPAVPCQAADKTQRNRSRTPSPELTAAELTGEVTAAEVAAAAETRAVAEMTAGLVTTDIELNAGSEGTAAGVDAVLTAAETTAVLMAAEMTVGPETTAGLETAAAAEMTAVLGFQAQTWPE